MWKLHPHPLQTVLVDPAQTLEHELRGGSPGPGSRHGFLSAGNPGVRDLEPSLERCCQTPSPHVAMELCLSCATRVKHMLDVEDLT